MQRQIKIDDILQDQAREEELSRPWFLQRSSAPVVKFIGEEADSRRIGKDTLGFVNGSRGGEVFDTSIFTRSNHVNVRYVDLVPMKVTEFTDEEINMKWPKAFEKISIVDNATMKIIDTGYLIRLMPDCCYIANRTEHKMHSERRYDLIVHHIDGYRPNKLLVWKE